MGEEMIRYKDCGCREPEPDERDTSCPVCEGWSQAELDRMPKTDWEKICDEKGISFSKAYDGKYNENGIALDHFSSRLGIKFPA